MPKFSDIRTCYNPSGMGTYYEWEHLEETLAYLQAGGLDLDPDFQRGHVWREAQQIAFVEACLENRPTINQAFSINRGPWYKNAALPKGEGYSLYVLVDGKQRLTAIRRFLNDEIPAFGYVRSAWEGRLPYHMSIRIVFGELNTRADVLKWYVGLNDGGTPHTPEEINRVKALLTVEEAERNEYAQSQPPLSSS